MGNRAVITTAPFSVNNVGIYLHWNGGEESVLAFLGACKELGFRTPESDPSYAMGYLVSIIGLFFEYSGTSLGIGICKNLDCDNGDNGTYLIGKNWEIVGRKHHRECPDSVNQVAVAGMQKMIVDAVARAKSTASAGN